MSLAAQISALLETITEQTAIVSRLQEEKHQAYKSTTALYKGACTYRKEFRDTKTFIETADYPNIAIEDINRKSDHEMNKDIVDAFTSITVSLRVVREELNGLSSTLGGRATDVVDSWHKVRADGDMSAITRTFLPGAVVPAAPIAVSTSPSPMAGVASALGRATDAISSVVSTNKKAGGQEPASKKKTVTVEELSARAVGNSSSTV